MESSRSATSLLICFSCTSSISSGGCKDAGSGRRRLSLRQKNELGAQPKPNSALLKAEERRKDATTERCLGDLSYYRYFPRANHAEIAEAAEVATGAAYYYFDSKESLVMAFYERAQRAEMPRTLSPNWRCKTARSRLRSIIRKFEYFGPNRRLWALFRPTRTLNIRCHLQVRRPNRFAMPILLSSRLPRLSRASSCRRTSGRIFRGCLWMYQMGLILFWVYDKSPHPAETNAGALRPDLEDAAADAAAGFHSSAAAYAPPRCRSSQGCLWSSGGTPYT